MELRDPLFQLRNQLNTVLYERSLFWAGHQHIFDPPQGLNYITTLLVIGAPCKRTHATNKHDQITHTTNKIR